MSDWKPQGEDEDWMKVITPKGVYIWRAIALYRTTTIALVKGCASQSYMRNPNNNSFSERLGKQSCMLFMYITIAK